MNLTETPPPDSGPILPDPPAEAAPFPVYIWLAKPAVGPETPIMVWVGTEHGPVSRPLLAVDSTTANEYRELAVAAARDLQVDVVLREFECVSLLDSYRPGTDE